MGSHQLSSRKSSKEVVADPTTDHGKYTQENVAKVNSQQTFLDVQCSFTLTEEIVLLQLYW